MTKRLFHLKGKMPTCTGVRRPGSLFPRTRDGHLTHQPPVAQITRPKIAATMTQCFAVFYMSEMC